MAKKVTLSFEISDEVFLKLLLLKGGDYPYYERDVMGTIRKLLDREETRDPTFREWLHACPLFRRKEE